MSEHELLKSALSTTNECLGATELETFARADVPEQQGTRAAHLASCSRCQAELTMLKTFINEEPLSDEGASVAWISAELERRLPKIIGRQRAKDAGGFLWWSQMWSTTAGKLAFAGTALAVAAITVAIWIRPSQPVLVADAGQHSGILRSEEVANLQPAGDIPEKPSVLRWQAVPSATAYKVEVMEVDETVLWTAQTSIAEISLPTKVRDKMLSGKPILWRVAALAANGNRIAASQVERFRVIISH